MAGGGIVVKLLFLNDKITDLLQSQKALGVPLTGKDVAGVIT
jgi:hypothetical protein